LVGDKLEGLAHAVFGEFLFGFPKFSELAGQDLEGFFSSCAKFAESFSLAE
jgi:hypothetical protein